jgi:hypothetical protein
MLINLFKKKRKGKKKTKYGERSHKSKIEIQERRKTKERKYGGKEKER